MTPCSPLFPSFWMGGFECSSHINPERVRLDMSAAIQHDRFALADYRLLRDVGIQVARDGLRWHRIDHRGRYDWSSWTPMLHAAAEAGVQVIWDLFHYGWPDDLDIFSPQFVQRFALFCGRAAEIYRQHSSQPAWYSPMNEISFFSWGAARNLIFPYAHGRDSELKTQIVRAGIAGIQAIRSVDPSARFLSPEPLIHNVAPLDEPWNTGPAEQQRASQFEAWDAITGRIMPELGGREEYLDVVGLNFYAANEWECPSGRKLHWDAGSDDPRWMPLNQLITEVHSRYQRPVIIAETSHYGIGRGPWLDEIAVESAKAIENGALLEGVCLYPILDRYDWNDSRHWHNCGLWDLKKDSKGIYQRVLNHEYAQSLKAAQALLQDVQNCERSNLQLR